MRWPEGARCAHCQSANVGKLVVTKAKSRSKDPSAKPVMRRLWNCKACKAQFTAKTGTIFEDSALGLDKWLPAIWMICNAKNGVSSCELARSLGVTQKSAWFMGHRIRLAMHEGSFSLNGEVEADETYIYPAARKMNKKAKARRGPIQTGPNGKQAVQGVLQRSEYKGASRVALEILEASNTPTMQRHIRNRVAKGASLYTDNHSAYATLRDAYNHDYVDHAVEYANGKVSTNGLENFWSLLKRTLKGTYVHVSPMHLVRYLDEQATRFNERIDSDGDRFLLAMQRVSGRGITYAELIEA